MWAIRGNQQLIYIKNRLMLDNITKTIVTQSRQILGPHLAGIYLHGSAAMGCFHEKKSDIDLLVVVYDEISDQRKRRYMNMMVAVNAHAPEKGIEFSLIKKDVCKPFLYPTPFELHFSITHLQWYKADPSGYIEKMKGTDKDLAAHITILYHRGKCLWGEPIRSIFEDIKKEFYFDSIWNDVKNAREEIKANPTYVILNLCRVLAYQKNGMILSKQEGGNWGIDHLPRKYHGLVLQALAEYSSDTPMVWDDGHMVEYAAYMIEQIQAGIKG